MADLKLTIDQLKNYLGTGLKVTFDADEYDHDFVGLNECREGVELISIFGDYGTCSIDKVRPICYRLSDLDRLIPELGFVPLQELFQMAYQSVYQGRFEGEFDSDPNLGKYLAIKAKEHLVLEDSNPATRDWYYGFTVEFTEQFLFTANGDRLNIPIITMYEKLFQWHFWPFGDEYFEAGLVIDKMKMNDH